MILVGTKLDLREDTNTIMKLRDRKLSPVSFAQGLQAAKDLGAIKWIWTLHELTLGIWSVPLWRKKG